MARRMSTSRRKRIFDAAQGVCHLCGLRIDGAREAWDVEHVVPYALTRDDTDANLRPAHKSCHATKTRADLGQIAKAKRVAAKHSGAWKAKARLPGSRGGRWKRKINGTVIERDDR